MRLRSDLIAITKLRRDCKGLWKVLLKSLQRRHNVSDRSWNLKRRLGIQKRLAALFGHSEVLFVSKESQSGLIFIADSTVRRSVSSRKGGGTFCTLVTTYLRLINAEAMTGRRFIDDWSLSGWKVVSKRALIIRHWVYKSHRSVACLQSSHRGSFFFWLLSIWLVEASGLKHRITFKKK